MPEYERIKYEQVVIYEFLLPLTRADKLRRALDNLFYRDIVRRRLAELDQDQFAARFERSADEGRSSALDLLHIILRF